MSWSFESSRSRDSFFSVNVHAANSYYVPCNHIMFASNIVWLMTLERIPFGFFSTFSSPVCYLIHIIVFTWIRFFAAARLALGYTTLCNNIITSKGRISMFTRFWFTIIFLLELRSLKGFLKPVLGSAFHWKQQNGRDSLYNYDIIMDTFCPQEEQLSRKKIVLSLLI